MDLSYVPRKKLTLGYTIKSPNSQGSSASSKRQALPVRGNNFFSHTVADAAKLQAQRQGPADQMLNNGQTAGQPQQPHSSYVYLKKNQVKAANYDSLRAQKYRQAKMKYKSNYGSKQATIDHPFEA